MNGSHRPKQASSGGSLRSIFLALLVVFLFRSIAAEGFQIPSGSAVPTLLIGDHIQVSKFSYGYSRYSLSFVPSAATGFLHGRIFGSDPVRGDMAVFINPHSGDTLIKRIVGLPGDRIQVTKGILNINGVPVKRERLADYFDTEWDESTGSATAVWRYHYVETLPNGVRHEILGSPTDEREDSGPVDDTGVYVVPAGHYFGMGDNRNNSTDSRYLEAVGFIPAENLIGRAEFQMVSVDGAPLWQFWKWPRDLRFSRFFKSIT
jgi:signal peptidase I